MPYRVEVDESIVLDYLFHPDRGLADADLAKLLDFLEKLEETGDIYRNDLSRRYPPNSPQFEVTYAFEDTTGRIRVFRFILSDAAIVYGVLRVRFVEEL